MSDAPHVPDVPNGTPDNPVFIDRSGRDEVEYRPLKPMLVTKAEIEREVARLAEGPFHGSRRSTIAHPALRATGALYPAVKVTLNVLLPGERTAPQRHNSSVVNFAIKGSGTSVIGGRTIEWNEYDTFTTPPWAIHQHINNSNELHVRLSYS